MYINDLIFQSNIDSNLTRKSYRMLIDCRNRQSLNNLQTGKGFYVEV